MKRPAAIAIFAILAGALAALQLWGHFRFRIDPDEIEHLHVAWLIAQGKVPFLDFFEHHPPLFNYLLVPIIRILPPFPGAFFGLRFATWLCWLATMIAGYGFVRTAASRFAAGAAMVLLGLNWIWSRVLWEARPDILMLALFAVSFWLLIRGWKDGRIFFVILSGACFGLSAIVIQKSLVILPPVMAWFAIEAIVHRETRKRTLTLSAAWIAPLVGLCGAALIVEIASYPDFWFWNFTFNNALSDRMGELRGWRFFGVVVFEILKDSPLLFGLGVAGIFLWATRSVRKHGATLVAACLFFGIAYQLRHMLSLYQYFLPALLFSAYFAAIGIDWVGAHMGRRVGIMTVCTGIMMALFRWNMMSQKTVAVFSQLTQIEYLNLVSKPADRFLGCPPIHPVSRPDAAYYWMNFRYIGFAFDALGQTEKFNWIEQVQNDPPEWIIPFYPKGVDYCYSIEELPKDLAARYRYIDGPVPLLRLNRDLPRETSSGE